MNVPHKHAALIKAWADGAQIQVYTGITWADITRAPSWSEASTYRIKPEITTSLSDLELATLYYISVGYDAAAARHMAAGAGAGGPGFVQHLRVVVDAAIKQYIKENTK